MTWYKVSEECGKTRDTARWVVMSLRDFNSRCGCYVPEMSIAALEQLESEYARRAYQIRLVVMQERQLAATMEDKESLP